MRRPALFFAAFLILYAASPVRADIAFASPAFRDQWQQGEAIQPNFWGPPVTFSGGGPFPMPDTGQQEPYKEAQGGTRLVQYFDKGRMELTYRGPNDGGLTNGLLTVELKTGKRQFGDATFTQFPPAKVNIAGDAGSDGPTYADLAQLPEKQPNADPAGYPYEYANGTFFKPKTEADFPFDVFRIPGGDPGGNDYVTDPGGRYGNVIMPFFKQFVPNFTALCGLPISPPFFAKVRVGGAPRWVLVQAFERRVLTYTPDNPAAFRVEFGNIGQQYYAWRNAAGATAPAPTKKP